MVKVEDEEATNKDENSLEIIDNNHMSDLVENSLPDAAFSDDDEEVPISKSSLWEKMYLYKLQSAFPVGVDLWSGCLVWVKYRILVVCFTGYVLG